MKINGDPLLPESPSDGNLSTRILFSSTQVLAPLDFVTEHSSEFSWVKVRADDVSHVTQYKANGIHFMGSGNMKHHLTKISSLLTEM